MSRRFSTPFLIAVLSSACSIDVQGNERTAREEKIFAVSGDVELTIGTFDGSIEVSSWDRNEVRVRVERRASSDDALAALDVRTTQEGGRIGIEAVEPRDRSDVIFGRGAPTVSLTVTAPRTSSVSARTSDGSIVVTDLSGDFRLETGDGGIRAERLEGTIRARTGDGAVRLADVRGDVAADTGDGGIQVTGVVGVFTAHTGDGVVTLEAAPGSAMKGDWRIETGDGSIMVRLPPSFDAEVDAHTGDGRIRVDGAEPAEREPRGVVRRRLGKGGPTIRLETGDGSIEVVSR